MGFFKSLVVLFVITAPITLRAEWNEKRVKNVLKDLSKGENDLYESSRTENKRIIRLEVGGHALEFGYVIDLDSQLCFSYYKEAALTIVPCEKIKQGYPIITPLLTWVK